MVGLKSGYGRRKALYVYVMYYNNKKMIFQLNR